MFIHCLFAKQNDEIGSSAAIITLVFNFGVLVVNDMIKNKIIINSLIL
jgi:hypothetical protein